MPNNDDVPALPPALADAIREYRELDEVPSEDRDSEWWTRYESVCARRDQLIDEVLVPKAEANHAELKPRLIALGKAAVKLGREFAADSLNGNTDGATSAERDRIHKECLNLLADLETPFNADGRTPRDAAGRFLLRVPQKKQPAISRDLRRLLRAVSLTRQQQTPAGGDDIRGYAQAILDCRDALPEATFDEVADCLERCIIAQSTAIQSRSAADGLDAWSLWKDLAFLLIESNDSRFDTLHSLLLRTYDAAELKRKTRKEWSDCFPAHLLRAFESQRDELLKSSGSIVSASNSTGGGDVSQAGTEPDENGYVMRPVEPSEYRSQKFIAEKVLDPRLPIERSDLTKIRKDYATNKVRWTLELTKTGEPIKQRPQIHFSDFDHFQTRELAKLPRKTSEDDDGDLVPSPKEVAKEKARVDAERSKR